MCEHLEHVIDQHEGSIICIQCGTVLEICIVNTSAEYKHFTEDSRSIVHIYLEDCCDRMNIPSSITEKIYKKYSSFRKNSNFEKIDNTTLMAYSIYFTLKDEGVGRNIEYIAYNTGVNSKQLWKCESLDTNVSIPISIESLLTPVYNLFDLSKQDFDNIIRISQHFQLRKHLPKQSKPKQILQFLFN